jgi:phosphate transport system substrate-binding protein
MTRSIRVGWLGRRRLFRVVAGSVLFFSTLVLASTTTSLPALAGGPAISGTGSSYAALAINQWDAEVSSEFQDTINYSTQSSVIGLNDFAQYPQVDFGASEIGYSTGQADQEPPAGFNYQYLPDIAGAECLDYNLSDTLGSKITGLKLNSAAMVGIFTGAITTWNNPTIKALNPGVLLPSAPIIVVYRSDASGDNFIFSDYLDTLQGAAWNAFTAAVQSPSGPQAIWPQPPSGERTVGSYNFGNWTSESGSDNASQYVYGNPDTITYVETGYAILHNDPCAQVQNQSGTYLAPSEQADAVALQNDVLQADLEQNLGPVFTSPQAGAYPVSAYSYLIMAYGNYASGPNAGHPEIPATKQPVEAQYVQFIACEGQKAAGILGYSPLPLNLVQADFDAVQRITGTALPPPTASNCADPYIDGSFNPPGAGTGPIITSTGGGGGAATSPVAATGTTTASGSHGTSAASGSASVTTTTLSAAARHAAARRAADVVAAAPGQTEGLAMQAASNKLLGIAGPTVTVVGATVLFILAMVAPPMVAFAIRRRRRHGSVTVTGEGGNG